MNKINYLKGLEKWLRSKARGSARGVCLVDLWNVAFKLIQGLKHDELFAEVCGVIEDYRKNCDVLVIVWKYSLSGWSRLFHEKITKYMLDLDDLNMVFIAVEVQRSRCVWMNASRPNEPMNTVGFSPEQLEDRHHSSRSIDDSLLLYILSFCSEYPNIGLASNDKFRDYSGLLRDNSLHCNLRVLLDFAEPVQFEFVLEAPDINRFNAMIAEAKMNTVSAAAEEVGDDGETAVDDGETAVDDGETAVVDDGETVARERASRLRRRNNKLKNMGLL